MQQTSNAGSLPVLHPHVPNNQQCDVMYNWHRKHLVARFGDTVPPIEANAGLIIIETRNRISPWAATKTEVEILEAVLAGHRAGELRATRLLRVKRGRTKERQPLTDAWAIFKASATNLPQWSKFRDDASLDVWQSRWLPTKQESGVGGVVDLNGAVELDRRYFTAEQAAEYLGGLNARTVSRWAREGYVPAIPIGEGKRRLWRFLQADLDAWMNSRRCGGELAA